MRFKEARHITKHRLNPETGACMYEMCLPLYDDVRKRSRAV